MKKIILFFYQNFILENNYLFLGGADYSEIAPPKSYINVEDFSTPSQLADYLQYLVKNQTAYEDYFQWKKYFKVYGTMSDQNRAMCQVCLY